jgi:peptidoglycan hydrolase-like protein with peptidoglycan-binding domain
MEDIEKAKRIIENWQLGMTSETHETGNRGAGTISEGKGDHGGVSYGTYQFSSAMGTLREYLQRSRYKGEFNGLTPVTSAFDAKWRELAATTPDFARDQYDFIRRTHYDPQLQRLKDDGIDLSDRGRAVQDALWSTAVQYRNRTPKIFKKGLKEKFGTTYKLEQLSDTDIVEAVQDYKIMHNEELFTSSKKWWPDLLKRAQEERDELVKLASYEILLARHGIEIPLDISREHESHGDVARLHTSHSSAQALSTKTLQESLNIVGYTDIRGRTLTIDGHYGKSTREAVEAFQRDHSLAVDGIAGPNTWAALREAARAQSAITTFPRMTPDLDADAIHTLQQHLNALDITDHHGRALSTTGVYDNATRAAVMNFQSAQRLPQTGVADPSTYALIEARATITKLQQITTPHAYTNDTNQRLAIMQAQLPEMHQQVEAIERQRPAEREKDDALSIPNEAVGHDAHPSFDTRNDYVPVPQATQKLGYSDPRHPVHALYANVKQRLEAQGHHLPENRLTQITGELHLRQFQPNWDGYITVQDDAVHAADYHPWGGILTLDLKEPAPSVHETMQQVATQQQAFAQELALRAQQTQSLGHGQALSL